LLHTANADRAARIRMPSVAERLHGDDTTVPILAKGKTIKGRIWTYVRDDRPFGGRAPPAVPVMLLVGRLMLDTRPDLIGSLPSLHSCSLDWEQRIWSCCASWYHKPG
jgi:hypothetical protein